MKSEDIDLRDEVQYLRELVETLMKELKEERATHEVIIYPPSPIIINPPAPQLERTPYWWHDHQQWFTNTCCTNNLTFSYNCDTNTLANNTDFQSWTGTNG